MKYSSEELAASVSTSKDEDELWHPFPNQRAPQSTGLAIHPPIDVETSSFRDEAQAGLAGMSNSRVHIITKNIQTNGKTATVRQTEGTDTGQENIIDVKSRKMEYLKLSFCFSGTLDTFSRIERIERWKTRTRQQGTS